MAKWFGSFLIRRWRFAGGAERIEIEHIQTGERALLDSLPAALDWIAAREGVPPAIRPDPLRIIPSPAASTRKGEPDE